MRQAICIRFENIVIDVDGVLKWYRVSVKCKQPPVTPTLSVNR